MQANTVRVAALVGAALLLATACSGTDDGATAQGDTGPSVSSTPAPKRPPAKQPIILAFGGDVTFEGIMGSRLPNPATALGRSRHPAPRRPRHGEPGDRDHHRRDARPGKEFTFRAPATAFTALKAAGVDVTSMANNHGMDYMEPGLRDSLAAIRRTRFPTVGIGRTPTPPTGRTA